MWLPMRIPWAFLNLKYLYSKVIIMSYGISKWRDSLSLKTFGTYLRRAILIRMKKIGWEKTRRRILRHCSLLNKLFMTIFFFSRIVAVTTSKQAWLILKTELQGFFKVIIVKFQTFHSDFKTLSMKSNESMQEFLFRVM